MGHVVQAEQLTTRERQILPLLAAGWSNREIAAQLGVKTGTVKNHVAKILEKLDVSDRTQAAVRAVELGLAVSMTRRIPHKTCQSASSDPAPHGTRGAVVAITSGARGAA